MSARAEPIEVDRCGVEVGESPGYWHFHPCEHPGKHEITTADGFTTNVCGTHKRQHDRIGLMRGNFARGHGG